ncbi:uncharacterized protein N7479_005271 [Penicillium vulpinum]|uniref:uncharacterized protein n=1 Tax=Penicillium vulpinum TaxID=29845 RepID=UPI00254794FF|nr:uncharacterized protein N7479_005271 [Penicillium vulpinum]KAJ5958121.1 hypothetical protein N7479_005271 [Penicillium vulpinum]
MGPVEYRTSSLYFFSQVKNKLLFPSLYQVLRLADPSFVSLFYLASEEQVSLSPTDLFIFILLAFSRDIFEKATDILAIPIEPPLKASGDHSVRNDSNSEALGHLKAPISGDHSVRDDSDDEALGHLKAPILGGDPNQKPGYWAR